MTTTFIETLIRKMHLDDSRIITLTGAGGKTTLLYALTGYLSRTENTLLTTTTHIMEPRDLPNAILVTREDAAALRAAFLSSRLAALGIPVSGPSGAAGPSETPAAAGAAGRPVPTTGDSHAVADRPTPTTVASLAAGLSKTTAAADAAGRLASTTGVSHSADGPASTTVASPAAADGSVLKWHAPSLSFLEEIRDIPARIVCEGDGSRRMPVKIPRPGEPVLYPGTDTVIGVIGLSCLGQPASECLFGRSAPGDHTHMTGNVFSAGMADNLQDHLGSALRASGGRITPDILAQIALSGQGLRKGVTTQHYHVLFNQADCLDMTALRAMQETAQKIRDNGTDCHIVSLKHHIFY